MSIDTDREPKYLVSGLSLEELQSALGPVLLERSGVCIMSIDETSEEEPSAEKEPSLGYTTKDDFLAHAQSMGLQPTGVTRIWNALHRISDAKSRIEENLVDESTASYAAARKERALRISASKGYSALPESSYFVVFKDEAWELFRTNGDSKKPLARHEEINLETLKALFAGEKPLIRVAGMGQQSFELIKVVLAANQAPAKGPSFRIQDYPPEYYG